jgi:hypothetical protein
MRLLAAASLSARLVDDRGSARALGTAVGARGRARMPPGRARPCHQARRCPMGSVLVSLLSGAVHRRPRPPCPPRCGRWRPVVNGGAHFSKACEGATLPWVQIPPPPPLTCKNTGIGSRQTGAVVLSDREVLENARRAADMVDSLPSVRPVQVRTELRDLRSAMGHPGRSSCPLARLEDSVAC